MSLSQDSGSGGGGPWLSMGIRADPPAPFPS